MYEQYSDKLRDSESVIEVILLGGMQAQILIPAIDRIGGLKCQVVNGWVDNRFISISKYHETYGRIA